jgi:hypothetical protein
MNSKSGSIRKFHVYLISLLLGGAAGIVVVQDLNASPVACMISQYCGFGGVCRDSDIPVGGCEDTGGGSCEGPCV